MMPDKTQSFLAALPGISGILVTPFDRDDQIAPRLLAPVMTAP